MPKHYLDIHEYRLEGDILPSLAAKTYVADTYLFPDPVPHLAGGWRADWGTTGRHLKTLEQAREEMANGEFPRSLKLAAMHYANKLAPVFQDVMARSVLRHQSNGRLDRHKLDRVAAYTLGDRDVQELRPYRRVTQTPSRKPRLAILASAGSAQMWEREEYIPMVATLALALAWAAESAGLEVNAALLQQQYGISGSWQRVQRGVIIAEHGRVTPLHSLQVLLDRDLFRQMRMHSIAADPDNATRIYQTKAGKESVQLVPNLVGYCIESLHGGELGAYGRAVWNADLTIGIGEQVSGFGKSRKPLSCDINLAYTFTLDQAVNAVIRSAPNLVS